jgi:hypothetical protein
VPAIRRSFHDPHDLQPDRPPACQACYVTSEIRNPIVRDRERAPLILMNERERVSALFSIWHHKR